MIQGRKPTFSLSAILEQTGRTDISIVSEIQIGENVHIPIVSDFETSRKEMLTVSLSAKTLIYKTNEANSKGISDFHQEV